MIYVFTYMIAVDCSNDLPLAHGHTCIVLLTYK